jgi:hypothetical protein
MRTIGRASHGTYNSNNKIVHDWECIQIGDWDAQNNAVTVGMHYNLCRRKSNRGYQLFLSLLKLDATTVKT